LRGQACFCGIIREQNLGEDEKNDKTGRAMILLELLIVLFISFFLSALFVLATRREGRRTGLVWIFLIIFSATWAGGIWIRPFGPSLFGIHWLKFLFAGMIFALFLAVSVPRVPPRDRHETLNMLERIERDRKLKRITYSTLSLSFWILLASLITIIIIRYQVM
jgi:hypothetical protein